MNNITESSKRLLQKLAEDAPNWGGEPLLDITKEARGNLTQLKRAGFLETFSDDEGCQWVLFSDEGEQYIREHFGLEIN